MIRYSKDVNVYVESKSSMCKMKLPVPQRAAGVYRHPSVAKNLEDPNARDITEDTLRNDYIQARELLVSEIITVYQILNAKGGLTTEEWTYFVSSITKSKFIFPDISLELGTNMKFQIDQDSSETLLKQILSEHGFRLKLIPSSRNAILYEDENEFLSMLSSKLSVNLDFENMEKRLDSADYSGTKKRLHYLTIYDFLKYHFGINELIPKEDLIHTLETSKDRSSANIIAFCDFVKNFKGDFWSEYEKYREYKMIEVLARWYGQSDVRLLSGEAFDYFADCINEPMFTEALQLLKVHTAYLNQRTCKVYTEGDTVKYSFRIQNYRGNITACVSSEKYDSSFINSSKKIKLTSPDELIISKLEYGKTYYISLWEVIDRDALKIGELPFVTASRIEKQSIQNNKSINNNSSSTNVNINSKSNKTSDSNHLLKLNCNVCGYNYSDMDEVRKRKCVCPICGYLSDPLDLAGDNSSNSGNNQNNIINSKKIVFHKNSSNSETPENEFKYKVLKDGTVEIYEYIGKRETVVIPSMVEKRKVSSFKVRTGADIPKIVKTIYLPKGMTEITKGAFSFCKTIKKIVIPNSVEIIGASAFEFCYDLEEVVIPNSVREIGKNAFQECKMLKSLKLPTKVSLIEKNAFSYCYSLEEVVIPGSVATIEDYVFWGCKSLKKVIISEGVTAIKSFAFSGCINLEISIPESVKKISIQAFNHGFKSYSSKYKTTILGKDKSYAQKFADGNPFVKFIVQ